MDFLLTASAKHQKILFSGSYAFLWAGHKKQPERKYIKLIQSLLSCKSIQKDLSFLFSGAVFAQHTEDDWHYILSHSLSHHCSIYSSHLHIHCGYFLERSRFSCSENTCCHFISFSFCQMLVMRSFKSCLENGNRLVIARKKTQAQPIIASVKEFLPSCLLLWVLIPNLWKSIRRLPLTLDQKLRDFCKRYIENILVIYSFLHLQKLLCLWCRRTEVQEILTLQTLAFVSNPLLSKQAAFHQWLYLPKSLHIH